MDQTSSQEARPPVSSRPSTVKKYTAAEAVEYLQALKKQGHKNIRPDCWVHNPLPSKLDDFLFGPKKTVKEKPKCAEDDWLGLTPGDIIYYYGAFGVKLAVHWGVYVGNGYVLEKWRDLKNPTKADIVLNPLALFGTEKNFVLCWDNKKFIKALILYRKKFNDFLRKEKNLYRAIYIASNPRVKLDDMIQHLPRTGQKDSYGLLTENCSHFVTEIEKGAKIPNPISSFLQVFDIVLQKKDPKILRQFCLSSFRFH